MNLFLHTMQLQKSWSLQSAKNIAMPKAECFGYYNDAPGVGNRG